MPASSSAVPAPRPEITSLEEILMREGGVEAEQIARAGKIAARMREPRTIAEILVELGQLTRAECDRLVALHRSQLDLGEILRADEALDQAGLEQYRARRSGSPNVSDREILVGGKLVPEEKFLRALTAKYNIPYIEPEVMLIEDRLYTKVSFPYLKKHTLLPFRIVEEHVMVVMANPLDSERTRELERIFAMPVRVCGAPAPVILETLKKVQERIANLTAGKPEEDSRLNYAQIRPVAEGEEIGAEAVRIVDFILTRALEMRASDVHIEPRERGVVVRVRVDGILHALTELPSEFAARIAARIKVLANADLAEHRLHQDGRIYARVEQREVDMRVSTYASVHGEAVTIRLLERGTGLVALDNLGFEPGIFRMVSDVVLRAPSGMILVTGPTGSGKTTTLYSFIDSMLDGTLKVITCEDPVEYVLPGVTQCQINAKSGPTFGDSLRAMMRQDPDVIVVGEIRDRETAALAIEAALTGHLVLSSFHTEDAVGAMVRLLELGVEPYLVSSTISCIISQRLVRRICPDCARPAPPAARDLRYLGLSREDLLGQPLMAGAGCESCRGAGYRGRLGIHEVLVLTDEFRDAVLRRAPARELRPMAKKCPIHLSLQESGMLKAVAGKTSLAEIVAQAPRDTEARPIQTLFEIATRKMSA